MSEVIARRYMKKPEAVEAIQLTKDNINFLANWVGGRAIQRDEYFALEFKSLAGTVRARNGDYITRTLYGEFDRVPQRRFESEYQKESMTARLKHLEQTWDERAKIHG